MKLLKIFNGEWIDPSLVIAVGVDTSLGPPRVFVASTGHRVCSGSFDSMREAANQADCIAFRINDALEKGAQSAMLKHPDDT